MKNSAIIGLCQFESCNDSEQNVKVATHHIRSLAKKGSNIICLQELFAHPYFCQTESYEPFHFAEPIPSKMTNHFSEIAKELDCVIILPVFEKRANGIYHNTACVIDADGTIIGSYRKMHIPDDPGFYEKFYFTPGDDGFKVFKTKYATIGVLICWDQWFPEAARLTALLGAEILFYPTAIGWLKQEKNGAPQKCQLKAWKNVQLSHAITNGVFVASVNRVGIENDLTFWGNSFVCNPFGKTIEKLDIKPQELVAECDLSEIDYYRQHWPFFRDRRIDSYQGIQARYLGEMD